MADTPRNDMFGVFRKTRKPDSPRFVYTPVGDTAYRVKSLELQPPEEGSLVLNSLIKVEFHSSAERDRFMKAVGRLLKREKGKCTPLKGREHVLLFDAPASRGLHLPLLIMLEKGALPVRQWHR